MGDAPTRTSCVVHRRAEKEQKAAAEEELDAWFDRTESRRELASSRKELDVLKALKADTDEDGSGQLLTRTASAADRYSKTELTRLQAASVPDEVADTLQQIAALKAELGLA